MKLLYRAPLAFLLCISLLFFSFQGSTWDESILKKAKSAEKEIYLTEQEKEIFFYSNLVRLNPQLFEKTILKDYIQQHKVKPTKYVKSLQKELRKLPPMRILLPRKDLHESAKRHAKDMGRSGKVGHRSSRGKSFKKRFKKLQEKYDLVGENCQYGYKNGIDIVIDLLIDQGVSDLGHRKNILNPEYQYMGTSILSHKKYRWNAVQNFGGNF